MNTKKLSDSELRDRLESRGVATHHIADRTELEAKYDSILQSDIRKATNSRIFDADDADLAGFTSDTLIPVNAIPIVSGDDITTLSGEFIPDVDLATLEEEVAKRRRYKELLEELRELNLGSTGVPTIAPYQQPQIPQRHAQPHPAHVNDAHVNHAPLIPDQQQQQTN